MSSRNVVLMLAVGALFSVVAGCSGDEGTTPNCPSGKNDCFTQPDAKANPPASDAGANGDAGNK